MMRPTTSQNTVILQYQSRPDWRRQAYFPSVFFLSASWMMSLAIMASVVSGLFSGLTFDSTARLIDWIVFGVSSLLVIYLIAYTKQYVSEFARRYEFAMTDREIQLRVDHTLPNLRQFAHMPYSDMSFVEYLKPHGRETFIFHGSFNRVIEVPIWSMTKDVSRIFELLAMQGIRVVIL